MAKPPIRMNALLHYNMYRILRYILLIKVKLKLYSTIGKASKLVLKYLLTVFSLTEMDVLRLRLWVSTRFLSFLSDRMNRITITVLKDETVSLFQSRLVSVVIGVDDYAYIHIFI